MEVKTTPIEGLLLIEPKVFPDSRGDFFESYAEKDFLQAGILYLFVQDNQSRSHKNALRGMHFQIPLFDQGKLVRLVNGSALDVATITRKNSSTYKNAFIISLS